MDEGERKHEHLYKNQKVRVHEDTELGEYQELI